MTDEAQGGTAMDAARAEFDAAADESSQTAASVARLQQEHDARSEYFASELEKLGYPRDGGPVDATIDQKVIFALTGVSIARDELKVDVETVVRQRDAAIERADKAEAAAKKAKAKVAAVPAEKKPRALKPIAEGKVLDRDALKAAIADADDVQIAFVGRDHREVAGSPPQAIEGDVWKDHARGLMLDRPVTIHGPGQGGAAFEIAAYALIVDGEQVAQTQRSEPLTVVPGATIKLEDDIHF